MNLAVVKRLQLLQDLYHELYIPEAVRSELKAIPDKKARREVQQAPWIHPCSVQDRRFVQTLQLELDEGEAEAIALSLELPANLLLMDELRGRRIAERFSVRTLGVLGVLLQAKRRGIVTAVKPILDTLITKAGFWVGNELYAHVLHEAGEQDAG